MLVSLDLVSVNSATLNSFKYPLKKSINSVSENIFLHFTELDSFQIVCIQMLLLHLMLLSEFDLKKWSNSENYWYRTAENKPKI
jgi:hypothetical protein